jgi:hypothetical protein
VTQTSRLESLRYGRQECLRYKESDREKFDFPWRGFNAKCGASQRVWARGGMADARGLGPREETLAGSSPVAPTIVLSPLNKKNKRRAKYFFREYGSRILT